jgi:aryl-alcohol dehydrogenase-like predicted oxidoreductase
MKQRSLGNTGQLVSVICMGGAHLGVPKLPAREATRLIHGGIERGITFLDNCWDYHDGESERRMGNALAEGGRRDRVVLMTKFDGRDRRSALLQLDESLRRLRTDRVDLWQLHENIRPDDAERAFAPGGAIEAMIEARRAGKVRFLGFTGHKDPAYHVHMLEVAAAHRFTFDTVQMPINVMDAHFRSFAQRVIPVAQQAGTAVLAMKTFGSGYIIDEHPLDPIEMLHYSLNLPVASVVTGIDSDAILDQAIRAAETFAPLDPERVAAMLAKTEARARSGATERYKTSEEFDGTTQHPEWLGSPAA